MSDIEFYDDGKNKANSHEVRVELELKQGTYKLRGIGGSREDAAKNAVIALNKFQTKAEVEAKTAIALIEMDK